MSSLQSRHLNHVALAPLVNRVEPRVLEDIPNIGKSLAADLRRIGIDRPCQLTGLEPYAMYRALCRITGVRQDPCVLDVFISAVRFMEGALARPWWHYTAERKRRYSALV